MQNCKTPTLTILAIIVIVVFGFCLYILNLKHAPTPEVIDEPNVPTVTETVPPATTPETIVKPISETTAAAEVTQ
jgi:hypothetical protein